MKYFWLLFSCLFSNALVSQSDNKFALKTITVDEGLSANAVFGVEQDSLGYLWFASPNGLNKYDGRTFRFYPKNFVSEDDIIVYDRKLYKDKEGILWVITGEREIEKYNTLSDSFEKNNWFPLPKTIFQDSYLNRFVGTSNNGIFKISNTTRDTIQLIEKKDFAKNVNGFVEFKDHIWASSTSGIFKIKKDNSYELIKLPILNNRDITLMDASIKHGLWVGTYMNGLYYLDQKNETFKLFEGFINHPLPKDIYIHNVFFDSKNRLWLGTYGQGIYLIDFQNTDIVNLKPEKNNPYTLHYDCISSVFEDDNQTIWFGTDGGGVSYYDEKLVKFQSLTDYKVPEGINLKIVKSLALDRQKNLWISTHNYGLLKLDSTKTNIETITRENSGLNSNKVAFIKQIGDDLWIANEIHEIQILHKDGGFTTFNKNSKPKLDVGYIYEIFQDSNKRIWLTTADNGLVQFDREKGIVKQFKYHPEDFNSISSNLIFSIEEGQDGIIWIGTKYKGLCRVDTYTNKVTRYPQIDGMLRTIFVDTENNLWIGTNTNGLIFFNPSTNEIKYFTESDGLAGNTIFSILPNEDELWLGSNKGISKLNMITNEIENFDTEEGLQSLEFNDNAAIKDIDNNMFYFGGLKGVNWFNPNNFEKNSYKPQTRISKIEVMDTLYNLYDESNFKSHQNTISFTFSSLHYSAPARNQFKYKLVNYDKSWQSAGNINNVRYTNLPPNDYEFQVISSNYDGVWNETPATYSFKINKPWFATNLAYTLYGLLILTALLVFFKYLKWRLQIKNKLEFEHKEATRLKQLDEFKNRLFTNISHEFRTPLTLISGPIDNQLNKPSLNSDDKEELSLVKRNAKRLLNLVNQILDLSKLESGHLKLNVSEDDLDVFLKQLAHLFDFKAKQKGLDFYYEVNTSDKAWFDRDALEKIVTNLLSNALKYTPQGGRIRFNAQNNDGQLIITVLNSGSTLNQDDLQKLFERYYQADKHSDGAGIGLSLVRELVTLSHGSIVAHIVNTDEIQFTVSLPIERSYFKASEISDRLDRDTSTEIDKAKVVIDALNKENQKDQPLILIVEDDEDIRLYLKSILKHHYKLIEATNGESGIDKALQNIPDLIISDVMMPIKDGIELCNVLKQDDKTSHVPIVLLTAKSDKAHEIEGLKIGADAYITKPFDKEKLLIQVKNLIELRLKLQQRYGQNFKLKEVAVTSIEQEFVNKLKTILDSHITDSSFTVEALSEHLAMSRMQLHRKIKGMIGVSASEFINNERLKLAVELLERTDRTIAEIAYETGFNSPSYFNRCFKKVYGKAPGSYIAEA
ncbi:two-component regulator propeller domain-containing protein [Winogradskyella sp. A3E31]|uniref:two-component regulator propeller domain-containing protein n=1 Tax=Winogradskyella sp. A3E31 TaxID=3349637 RepID=UPI00398B55BD